MGLPTTREHTYGANEPARSTDLNAIQDAIIGEKHPSHEIWQALSRRGGLETNVGAHSVDGVGVVATADVAIVSNPCTIDLKVGERITAIKAMATGTGAAQNITVKLIRTFVNAGVQVFSTVETLTIVDPPAAGAEYTKALAAPVTVGDSAGAGEAWFWRVDIGLNTSAVDAVAIVKDKL